MAALDRPTSAQPDEAWEVTVVTAYERHAKLLWEYGRRLGREPADAEDAVQEAFARLVHLPSGRRPTALAPWLFRTVHNLAVDQHRRSRRISVRPVHSIDETPQPTHPDDAQRLALWDAVDRLPPRQRETVFLRYRAGLDFATVGSILGISESGARANAFRAIEALRREAKTW